VIHTCRPVIPGMIGAGDGARLITVISEAGRAGDVGLEAYSAAKAGARRVGSRVVGYPVQ
jgi:2-hydroxycyclohexanecarboxyl-CoA dehydrogenase